MGQARSLKRIAAWSALSLIVLVACVWLWSMRSPSVDDPLGAEPFRRAAQRRLALEVTTTVHGLAATQAVVAASEALFGQGDLAALDAATLRSALEELPHAEVAPGTSVVQALVATGLCASLGEARRAIAQGGVSLDGARVDDEATAVTGGLPGGVSVLRRGKKTLAGLFVSLGR